MAIEQLGAAPSASVDVINKGYVDGTILGTTLTDPNADRIVFWDDSAGAMSWLAPSGGLYISGTGISAISPTTINAPGPTPTVDWTSYNHINYTGLAANVTSMTTNLAAGTPTDGQKLMLTFKDNATPRTITWGASFQSSGGATLLATTATSKKHMVALLWDNAASKWTCIAVDTTGY